LEEREEKIGIVNKCKVQRNGLRRTIGSYLVKSFARSDGKATVKMRFGQGSAMRTLRKENHMRFKIQLQKVRAGGKVRGAIFGGTGLMVVIM